jgi:large subunit ribosomal protein L11
MRRFRRRKNKMIVKLLVDGGAMKPGPALAQKIGPLGLNMGKIISDVNTATKGFAGMKVPVSLNIDTKTKAVKVEVASPPASGLLKKEIGVEKGTGASKKVKVGNISIEQVINIAKTKIALEKDLKSAVKSTIGACVSLGILIENKEPKAVSKEVEKGIYDKEIAQAGKLPSQEKLEKLKEFFESVKKKQEELLKKEEEEKAKEAAEAPAAAPGAAGAPAAGAKPGAPVPAPGAAKLAQATGAAGATKAPAKPAAK